MNGIKPLNTKLVDGNITVTSLLMSNSINLTVLITLTFLDNSGFFWQYSIEVIPAQIIAADKSFGNQTKKGGYGKTTGQDDCGTGKAITTA